MGKFVLGIGNVLLRDEGIGCHAVHALDGISLPGIKVIDGGTCPDVLQLFEDADKLVIVDAVRGGGAPGQIYRFHLEEISLERKMFLSLHEMGLVDNLMSMKLWSKNAETVIIGVEPKEVDWGLELSPELREKMPQIIDAIVVELNGSKGGGKC